VTGAPVTGGEARHQIANLLHTYTDIADRKDVAAAVELLGRARVRFPASGFDEPDRAAAFFTALWASPLPHRHDVSNLVVVPGDAPGTWTARARYVRWVLDPAPEVHTLGEYALLVREAGWAVAELTVARTWTRA
jgi:hypothetical protein